MSALREDVPDLPVNPPEVLFVGLHRSGEGPGRRSPVRGLSQAVPSLSEPAATLLLEVLCPEGPEPDRGQSVLHPGHLRREKSDVWPQLSRRGQRDVRPHERQGPPLEGWREEEEGRLLASHRPGRSSLSVRREEERL